MNSKIFCITGMHRSGTSLLANWMQEIGVVLDFGHLIPATYWNKKGHYEDENFVNFHQKALLDRFPKSHGWKVTTPKFLDFMNRQESMAKSLIRSHENLNCWGWKDPRSIFFAEAWLQLSSHIHVIVIYRPAKAVVTSLIKRAHLAPQLSPNQVKLLHVSVDQAIEMWKAHNHLALELKNRQDKRVTLFSIETLLNHDSVIFEHVNQVANHALKYIPVDNVCDRSLFCSDNRILDNRIYKRVDQKTKSMEQMLLKHASCNPA